MDNKLDVTINDIHIEIAMSKPLKSASIYYLFAHKRHDLATLAKLLTDCDIILCAIEVDNWRDDMTPWYSNALFQGNDDFHGKADDFIEQLTVSINQLNAKLARQTITLTSHHLVGFSLSAIFTLLR